MTKKEKERAREMLDTLYGYGPGGKLNHAYADGYYALSIEREFGMHLEGLKIAVDWKRPKSQ